MNKKTLAALEFDKILDAIAGFAHCDLTASGILDVAPFGDPGMVTTRFGQVEEIRRLSQLGVSLPLSGYEDVTSPLELVRPDGAVLSPHELLSFLPLFRILGAVSRQFAYRTDIPLLQEVAGFVTGFPDIREPLAATFDDEGNILDTASRLLYELRVKKRALTAQIRKRLEEIVRERSTAIFIQDEFVTQRGGRWVIPVRMDSKGMVPGVVHDVSNSGETAFMEPLEIIGLANELENLAAEEKAEQIRILKQLSGWLRQDADGIEREFAALVALDLLNSIASFAEVIQAEIPNIGTGTELRIDAGRHPLLLLNERQGGRKVVPLDLRLDSDSTVMVITGPNTGGKTIAIKTAGLLAIMALSGIPIPAAGTSAIPCLADLLVDIGDDQSIEANLSTFSAHVSKIASILKRADLRTLVLLDELGTGTEPGQGAAIACAVLEHLRRKGAMVLATTHLTDIVGFVHKTDGMVNAAMEFDLQSLSPLYRLKKGEPGQSHALEISRRYGLPEEVISFAEGMVGRLAADFQELLSEVKAMHAKAEEKVTDLEQRELRLSEKERIAAGRLVEMERERREAREKGLLEVKEILQAARRQVNEIIEEARHAKNRAARDKLAAAEREVESRLAELRPEQNLSADAIAVGSKVFIKSIGYDGTVLAVDLRHDRVRVLSGQVELEVPISALTASKGKSLPDKAQRRKPGVDEEAAGSLNIIGRRVEEALPDVERFLNDAALGGLAELRIVHGKGTGALRRGVREFLEKYPLVGAYRNGEDFEGGDGVTIVTLR